MTSTLEEQLGVATNAASWDVGDYRLWQSSVPGIIVYMPKYLRLAKEAGGRYQASLTQMQRWQAGAYEVTGGSATLSLFGDAVTDEESLKREQEWLRVVLNQGYTEAATPRFLRLPVRDLRLTCVLDASQASVAAGQPAQDGSRTLVVDLTSSGAQGWVRAVQAKSAIPGSVRLSYTYPQLMPQATASVTVRGQRVYAGLATMLSKAPSGALYGAVNRIREAWRSLVSTGAIEIKLPSSSTTSAAGTRDDLLNRLSEQACEQLFDVLFVPYASSAPDAALYALRWQKPADAVDLPVTISVAGWTWLSASMEAKLSDLLNVLDANYIQTAYETVSVPFCLVVEASPMVTSVAVSLNFSEGLSPQAPLFDSTGGTRQFLVSTQHPEQVKVTYHAKVNFKPSEWPVIQISGAAALMAENGKLLLRPELWLHRHNIYMYVKRDGQIDANENGNQADFLTVTASYQAPYLATSIRASSRITPQGPIEFCYPVPPGQATGKATVGAIGMVGGQLLQAADLQLQEAEDALYLLVDGSRLQLVGRNAILSESDPLAERLCAANSRPVVSQTSAPVSEDDRELNVSVEVYLIPQPTSVSCWAAALAMIVSARDFNSIGPDTVAAQAGMDLDTGYGWGDIRWAVSAWNLVEEGPQSAMPAEWARLLQEWGPLWIVEVGAPYHAVVVAAVRGDGTPEGTQITLYNPWPPGIGAIEVKPFLDFDTEFGLGAGAGAALVHA